MNNILKIKLNPYRDLNTGSLDGKPLSPYSELNNYMKEPFLSWASKLLDTAEREINDDYDLEVIAGTFEKMFLEGMQNDFDSCKVYRTGNFAVDTPISDRFDMVRKLALKYDVSYTLDKFKIPVYTELQLSVDASMIISAPVEKAMLLVSSGQKIMDQLKSAPQGAIAIVISDKKRVSFIGDQKYIWEIGESDLYEVFNSIIDRFVKIPVIVEIAHRLKNVEETMDSKERRNLALATEIDPFLVVSELPEIETGNSETLDVSMYPEGTKLPRLRLVVQNANIASADGLAITGLIPGSTFVDIYRDEENIPFVRKKLIVYQDNCVKQIKLSLTKSQMGIGGKQKLNVAMIPEDAQDVNLVKCSVDRPDIIKVNGDGEITALKDGTATITASTRKASAQITVTVLPDIKNIVLSVKQSHLYVGQTQSVSVKIEPGKCFDASYEWRSSDKEVAVVENLDNGQMVIRAKGIGSCILTCAAKKGSCSASCSVLVESTFKKRENIHEMLNITTALTVACLFSAALSWSIICLILMAATIVCGVQAIDRNKADRLWALILMVIAVLVTLMSLGIINFI